MRGGERWGTVSARVEVGVEIGWVQFTQVCKVVLHEIFDLVLVTYTDASGYFLV